MRNWLHKWNSCCYHPQIVGLEMKIIFLYFSWSLFIHKDLNHVHDSNTLLLVIFCNNYRNCAIKLLKPRAYCILFLLPLLSRLVCIMIWQTLILNWIYMGSFLLEGIYISWLQVISIENPMYILKCRMDVKCMSLKETWLSLIGLWVNFYSQGVTLS